MSVVIDPDYVREHAGEFKAVGSAFAPDNPNRRLFSDQRGQLLNGFQYEEVETIGYDEVFLDEVLTQFVPPDAIIGVIANQRHVDFVKEDLRRIAPDRKIIIYDIEGTAQFLITK